MSNDDELLEWIAAIPFIGGRKPLQCAVCKGKILTPADLKQCRSGFAPEWAHKTCWQVYRRNTAPRLFREALKRLRRLQKGHPLSEDDILLVTEALLEGAERAKNDESV